MAPGTDSSVAALYALVSTLPLVVYTATLDEDPRPRYISPKVEELLGIDQARFTFNDLRTCVHPEDRDRVLASFDHADANREPLTLEYRFVRPDGRVVWLEDNSRVVVVDGEPLAQGYLLDITERKRTEEVLTRNASVRRRVADIGRIALAGATYAEVVELSLEALREGVDADFGSFLEDDHGVLHVTHAFGWQAVGAVAQPGTPASTAFETCTTYIGATDRSDRPDSLMERLGVRSSIAVPVVGDSGRCFAVMTLHLRRREGFSAYDVSLVEQTANLIGAAASRERLEERLRGAERLEAVGHLAAGVAHDFNNLLQAISGYTELAAGRADEKTAGYLGHVAHAADRAKELTAQLLAYSRKQDMQPRQLQLAQLVSDVRPMLAPLLGESIELEVAVDATLGVVADAALLENALINLAANARDAMPNGGRLRIDASQVDVGDVLAAEQQVARGRYAAILVTDDGEGMTPDVAARIFEPFFTTKPREKGTGLGLASVVGTIRQSGGFVTVDSERGRGTTLALHLPLA